MGFPLTVPLTGEQILTITTDKRHPLGTRGTTRDGRVFRYAKAGATALKVGLLVQSAVPDNAELILDSGTTKVKANSTRITLICSATCNFATANAYAEAYLWGYSSSTAKSGVSYGQLKGHTTQTATKNGLIKFDFISGDSLYSGSTVYGTTAGKFAVIRHPYDKVVVKPAGLPTALPAGIPPRTITASNYFWLQTWGPCPVRSTGILDIGRDVGPSSGATAGVCDGVTSTKVTSGANSLVWSQIRNLMGASIGQAMLTGVAGEYRMVFLKLAP